MKYTLFFLSMLFLLSGCGAAPEPVPETVQPVMNIVEEALPPVTEPETQATEPQDPLELLLEIMSTEHKVGQLFLARCPADMALEDVKTYHLGGYVLFGRDVDGQTPETLRAKLWEYQVASSIPMFIAVDEEGGAVCRVSNHKAFRSDPFGAPRWLYAAGGMDAVLAAEEEKAELLKSLGINVNLAPVCDITTTPGAILYSRSLGQSPEITGDFVAGAVEIMNERQVGSVMKHFPGYGNNRDTHTGTAVDERSLEQLESADLIPFQRGIDAGCGAVMVSHNTVKAFDETLPASLSPAVHTYLREKMGFDGVIMTDDLDMGAVGNLYIQEEAAVLAVLAGNDILCTTQYRVQYPAVLDAVKSGRIPMELLDEAVMRILRWKQSLGLLY